jgi:putative DNA methylase
MTPHRKLIEVALPLESISEEAAQEKFLRTGHPSTLHPWWSRKPLVACRAILFASLVDDPGEYIADTEAAGRERERLLDLLEKLARWENNQNSAVLDKARLEIARSLARLMGVEVPIGQAAILRFLAEYGPVVLDPFAGGGSILLEAQRLGLPVFAGDLNPVAVLLSKASLEVPANFAGLPPVRPPAAPTMLLPIEPFKGAEGLIEDVRYYGQWMQKEAQNHLGGYYPLATLPVEGKAGQSRQVMVVAWLWVRTAVCPNPSCRAQMPLTSSFTLAQRQGRTTYVEPLVDRSSQPPAVQFTIRVGNGKPPEGTVKRNGVICVACGSPVSLDYVRDEAQAGRLGSRLLAIATEGSKGRTYLPPNPEHERLAAAAKAAWGPDAELPAESAANNVSRYGLHTFADLFTPRQLLAMTTFADLVAEARKKVYQAAVAAGMKNDDKPLSAGGSGARAYAEAVSLYLALTVSKTANRASALTPWGMAVECPVNLFSRQAIAMSWLFAESNVIAGPSGSFGNMLDNTLSAMSTGDIPIPRRGQAEQIDAQKVIERLNQPLISTDPPYYDAVPYADLSDFFYVWLRAMLRDIYPDIFQTALTPKTQELVADKRRLGGAQQARSYFESGMRQVFSRLRSGAHPDYPVTIYYAFRQAESDDIAVGNQEGEVSLTASTGWETMLEGLLQAGFMITGTWPVRTERAVRMKSLRSNALATSIVLVCRPRLENAPSTSRRELLAEIRKELGPAIRTLQMGNIAPVDLAQAALGPGMAVYSRYAQVFENDGSQMRVRTALGLINQVLDEVLAEQEGDYDTDTRWAMAWFEQYGYEAGPYGIAETLSKAKNTSLDGLVRAGILEARAGEVRLLRLEELTQDWDPQKDQRLTVWEAVQHLIHALDQGGEQAAADLLARLGSTADAARELAYRQYVICERKKWAQEAMYCNMLVIAWPRLRELASRNQTISQGRMF